MGLYQTESSNNDGDKQDGEYYDYRSKTRLGSRYDTIIALYGTVNWITLWRYWNTDSILKQSVMLLDKSGLRKKPSPQTSDPRFGTGVAKQSASQEEIDDAIMRITESFNTST